MPQACRPCVADCFRENGSAGLFWLAHGQCLLDIGEDIVCRFDTDGEANQIRRNAGCRELFIRELAVRMGSRVKDTGAGVGDMGCDGDKPERIHETDCAIAAALETEGNDAGGSGRHVFLRAFVLRGGAKTGIVDPRHIGAGFEEFGDAQRIRAVAGDAQVERFEAEIEKKRVHGCGGATEIAHHLCDALGDITALSEAFAVDESVVGIVGGREARERILVRHPIEVSAIDDSAADLGRVAVHVFCRGVGDDIDAEVEGAAVDWRRERVVDDKRNAVFVCAACPFFEIENMERRVGERFAEDALGIGAESGVDGLFVGIRIEQREFDSHLSHRHGEQIGRAAVEGGRGDHVIACVCQVEDGKEVSRLTGGGQHTGDAAFERGDFGGDGIACRVLQPGVEIAGLFEIEKRRHFGRAVIFEGCGLDDGENTRLAIFRLPTSLNANGIEIHADFFLFGISEENQMMVDSKGYGVECKRFEESPENGKIRKRKTMP